MSMLSFAIALDLGDLAQFFLWRNDQRFQSILSDSGVSGQHLTKPVSPISTTVLGQLAILLAELGFEEGLAVSMGTGIAPAGMTSC